MAEKYGSMHAHYRVVMDAYVESGRPFFHQVTPVEARAMLRDSQRAAPPPVGLPELAQVIDETIEAAHGSIPIRRYVPSAQVMGSCLYLHAGGWVIGDLDFSDATCRRFAAAARCEVISVDYRLAPENPWPAGLDDAYAALEWMAAHRTSPLAIMGESAGGNLAAACTIRARDSGGPVLSAQVLAYPVTDHNLASASYSELGDRNWLLSTADMRWFWNHYCPAPFDRTDPLVSPLHVADAAGLPPAWISVAELDPLREEGLAYARHLASAGVPVRQRCDRGMLHGYLGAAGAVSEAAAALDDAAGWLREQLG